MLAVWHCGLGTEHEPESVRGQYFHLATARRPFSIWMWAHHPYVSAETWALSPFIVCLVSTTASVCFGLLFLIKVTIFVEKKEEKIPNSGKSTYFGVMCWNLGKLLQSFGGGGDTKMKMVSSCKILKIRNKRYC